MPFLPLTPPPGMFRNGTRYQSKGRWFDGNLVRWHEQAMRPVGGWERFGEGAATITNLIRHSYRVDRVPWTADNVTLSPASSHYGLSARSITGDDSGFVSQDLGELDAGSYTVSAVLESSGTSDAILEVVVDQTITDLTLDFVSGTVSGTGDDPRVRRLGTGPNAGLMFRVWFTVTLAADEEVSVAIYPSDDSTEQEVAVHHVQVASGPDAPGLPVFTEDEPASRVSGRADVDQPISGMIAWRDNEGLGRLAMGTNDGLYVYVDGTVADVSPAGFVPGEPLATTVAGLYGSGVYGSGIYGEGDAAISAVQRAQTWQFDTFGQLLLGVAESDGRLYRWDLDAGEPAEEVVEAPEDLSGLVVTPERFVFVLGAGGDGRTVAWADQESLTDWTPTSENQAGDFPLSGNGNLMAGRRGRGETLLWTDKALWTAQFIGGTLVYRFREVGTECGPISKRAMTMVGGNVAIWMGQRNFFVYDGHVQVLPSEVGDYVFSDLNRFQASQVHCGSVSEFNEVWWYYPSGGSEIPDRYVAYNYVEGTWHFGNLSRTAMVDRGVFGRPVAGDFFGVPYLHEDPDGGQRDFLGNTIPCFAESGPIELGNGDNRMWVVGLIPDERTLGGLEARISTSGYPTEPRIEFGPFDPAEPTNMRVSGRDVSLRVDQVSNRWRLGVPRLDVRVAEKR